jgi:NADH-quinone oxidoreductase subunit L
VIAYSTLSQLGYMAFGLGVGAWIPAIFHLMTHAFFKGLLFLGAGSVIHGMHDEQDIRNMGGLRKFMPITFITFLTASFANAGVVPFAGFWSKDDIILGGWTSQYQPIGKIVAVVGLVAAFFTGLYMFRLVFLVFTGKPRFDEHAVHPHESPPTMTIPLILLAIPSLLIGFVGVPPGNSPIEHFLEPVFAQHAVVAGEPGATEQPVVTTESAPAAPTAEAPAEAAVPTSTKVTMAVISTIVALSGIFVAWLTYVRGTINATEVATRYQPLYLFLRDKWRWDELYDAVIITPFKHLANFLWRVVDEGIIDATVNGVAGGIGAVSQRLRHVQTGLVTNYALVIALGMVLIVGVWLGLFSNLFR